MNSYMFQTKADDVLKISTSLFIASETQESMSYSEYARRPWLKIFKNTTNIFNTWTNELYVHNEMQIFLSSCVDVLQMTVKKDVERMWKNFIEMQDLEGLIPLLDQVYLSCAYTQHEATVDPVSVHMKSAISLNTDQSQGQSSCVE